MNGLKKAAIEIDRKILADLAVFDKVAFGALAAKAKASLSALYAVTLFRRGRVRPRRTEEKGKGQHTVPLFICDENGYMQRQLDELNRQAEEASATATTIIALDDVRV